MHPLHVEIGWSIRTLIHHVDWPTKNLSTKINNFNFCSEYFTWTLTRITLRSMHNSLMYVLLPCSIIMQNINPCNRGCKLGGKLQMEGIECVSIVCMIIMNVVVNSCRSKLSITSSPCSRRTSMANPCAGFRDSWTCTVYCWFIRCYSPTSQLWVYYWECCTVCGVSLQIWRCELT